MARRTSSGKRLKTYRSRRDFRKTPEPAGRPSGLWKKRRNPIFVVQQHDATTMHFDFRIEIGGVLKSWAVPKGPSTDPREKRLAVQVEDHPLEYADFEGVIPADEHGGGPVIVWDAGPYRNLKRDDDGGAVSMEESLRRGTVEVWLEGRKIRGGYALVRSAVGGDRRNWLLVKMKDEGADGRRNPVSTEPRSVLSGRTLEEVSAESAGDEDDSAA